MEYTNLIQVINKELAIEIPEKRSYSEIHAELAEHLNHLIKDNFDKLIAYLYRIDVNEQKLKSLLMLNPHEDAGNIIASLIIERQLEKIKSREQFSPRDNDLPTGQAGIDESEKW